MGQWKAGTTLIALCRLRNTQPTRVTREEFKTNSLRYITSSALWVESQSV